MNEGRVSQKQRIATALKGAAGEHYVVAELLRRGAVAALSPRNAPMFDVLATKGNRTVKIRVKTKLEKSPGWRWNARIDDSIFDGLIAEGNDDFVVLVDLTQDTKNIAFYVLPTVQVSAWLSDD